MESRGRAREDVYSNHSFPAEKPCRTCVDFKTWAKQHNKPKSDGTSTLTNLPTSDAPRRKDCPLDKDELGSATWGFLHTMAANFPEKPTLTQRTDMTQFFSLFSKFYPCEPCADDLRKELKKTPPVTDSQESLSQWLCRMHNTVNVKLGKSEFDCSQVNERWRDGWKDGSCD